MENFVNWLFADLQEHWMVKPLLRLIVAFFFGYLIACLLLGIGRFLNKGRRKND